MKTHLRLLDGLPFVKIYTFFTIGVLFSEYTKVQGFSNYFLLISGLLFLVLSIYSKSLIVWICTLILFGFGIHSINSKIPNLFIGEYLIQASVVEEPIEKAKSFQIVLKPEFIKKNDSLMLVIGNQLISAYTAKSDKFRKLRYGDRLTAFIKIDTLMPPLNPYEFNFKKKMERKKIFYRAYIGESQAKNLACRRESIKGNCLLIRNYFLGVLSANIHHLPSLNIAKSLIIGDRTSIDQETIDSYSNTGTIHLLSVSGLHIGVFVWLFGLIFSKYLPKFRVSRFISILIFVWLYGLISGMSPPVMRCALMFSIIEFGILLNRKTNILNLIACAAWFLLLYDSQLLFDIGYQLSFLAMTGIVIIFPKIYSKIVFENQWADKIWELCIGCFAAWLLTFPLVLYYFHKIALLGNFANVIAVPLSTGILYAGLLLFIIHPITVIANTIGLVIDYMIRAQNTAIILFDFLPFSSIQSVAISEYALYFVYLIILLFLLYFCFKRVSYLIIGFILILAICGIELQTSISKCNSELISFNFSRNSLLAFKNRDTLYVLGDSLIPSIKKRIDHYGVSAGIKSTLVVSENCVRFNGLNFILIQNPNTEAQDSFELAVLSYKACKGYKFLIGRIRAKKWILDSSISPYYREKIEIFMTERNIHYYSVSPTTFAYIQKF